VTGPARLLLDKMLSGEIAAQLRAHGHDVLAVADPALVAAADEEVLAHATAEGRCLLTANVRDFTVLSTPWGSRGRSHAGSRW
jgi:predicted nuclease of predicted toxin-antitoxin system